MLVLKINTIHFDSGDFYIIPLTNDFKNTYSGITYTLQIGSVLSNSLVPILFLQFKII